MPFGVRKLAKEADRIRVEFLDTVNRGDAAGALRIGTERLLPVSEDLVARSNDYLNPLGVTLRNLSAICQQLGRPIGQFHFAQRSFHVASRVSAHGLALHPGLADTGGIAATIAGDLAGKGSPRQGALKASDQQLLLPTAALVPTSIELMGRIDSFPWACRMRLAATKLRMLSHRDLKMVDCESRAMVWLARLALEQGDRRFATAEVKEALLLWIDQLGSTSRYWSTELQETWTVAAEVLDSLGHRQAATSIRRAIHQATAGRQGTTSLSALAGVLDLRQHYLATLSAF
ncbi:hypothetical protein SAMN05443287_104329 [Micromonospora phaseoli]|uniref:Uncharacterized protein n=1 Tax=Micromonospora phaseoli TaxID=1144548 RepID=A0A1H6YV12_9ACTN|nr:hypothetical protein [Micromonospora phaseoli]PZW00301.1 hypothetical protein CLV64_103328 [Micromonospora phaseoli]GIJ76778.1 hypothetical protein Xph01_12100 [Micromonospora phaseoli]SEJ42837.1 hypothetical protein SAMN05443287_104329 [Micromonospora phaseoli]